MKIKTASNSAAGQAIAENISEQIVSDCVEAEKDAQSLIEECK